MKKAPIPAWLGPMTMLLLAACSNASTKPPPTGKVAAVKIIPDIGTIVVGGRAQLTAVTLSAAGDTLLGREVAWSSSDVTVASITVDGLVAGRGSGTAQITASSEGIDASVSIMVEAVDFTSVSAGSLHSCGLTTGGRAYCWGANHLGQLGAIVAERCDALDRPCSTAPRGVLGGHSFAWIRPAGSSTCGITTGGEAYCWGSNTIGQLGVPTMETCDVGLSRASPCSTRPLPVAGGLTFALVVGGNSHNCGLRNSDEAYCWGSNAFGQLGVPTTEICSLPSGPLPCSTTPVPVGGVLAFASLGAGSFHTCGVTRGSEAYCWGNNFDEQVGATTTEICRVNNFPVPCSTTPVAVSTRLMFASIAAAESHTCALTPGGDAYCWGNNSLGQLGDGTTTDRSMPVAVVGGHAFTSLTTGSRHTCGVTTGGEAYCWGHNDSGQLGVPTGTACGGRSCSTAPVLVSGGLTFASISGGTEHTCGLTGDKAYCWGSNVMGQLGDGTTTDRTTPVPLTGQQ